MKRLIGLMLVAAMLVLLTPATADAGTRSRVCDATVELTTCAPPVFESAPLPDPRRRNINLFEYGRELFVEMLFRMFGR